MRCKIIGLAYVSQYHKVNQKSKKIWFYIIVLIANPCDARESY